MVVAPGLHPAAPGLRPLSPLHLAPPGWTTRPPSPPSSAKQRRRWHARGLAQLLQVGQTWLMISEPLQAPVCLQRRLLGPTAVQR
eukprot:1274473-Prorocentrum_lima.AAC.1